jgi:GGDEF domain-containing protein
MQTELDSILREIVDILKKDIRIGLDLAARFDQACFLLTLTGAPLHKAEEVATKIQQDVLNQVLTLSKIPVQVQSGAAEYSVHTPEFNATIQNLDQQVHALIEIAQKNCCVRHSI